MKIKKFISVLLIFALCFQLLTTAAWAEAQDNSVYPLRGDVALATLAEAGAVALAAEDDCALTALQVIDFYNYNQVSGKPPLILNPEFTDETTEYVVDTLDATLPNPNMPTMSVDNTKQFRVKATGPAGATITAQLNGGSPTTVTSGKWQSLGSLEPGKYNILQITVTKDDASKTYTVTVPMNGLDGSEPSGTAGPTKKVTGIEVTTPPDKTDYLAGEAFDPAGMVVIAKYDNGDTEELGYDRLGVSGYSYDPLTITAATEAVTLRYKSNHTARIPVSVVNAQITVPSDATLFVGEKPKRESDGKTTEVHYVPFKAFEPVSKAEGDGVTTYYFKLPSAANGTTYNYRISGENYVTYAGKHLLNNSSVWKMEVAAGDLLPAAQRRTVDRDISANRGYNVADIYLNINPQNYLKLANGATYQLVNLRAWQATDTITENYFIEPDYHYTVIDEYGDPSGVVTVDENGLITAKENGTAIVLVTYDAISFKDALGGPFFGAIWPENTGVFVVSVGAGESGIDTGMKLNAGRNDTANKLAGDAIDSEHDVIYFTGDRGAYTFIPGTAGCDVAVANPTVGEAMTFNGFVPVEANADGSFTVPLAEGRNIVRIGKGGAAEYQVITAKKVTVTVNKGEAVHPGDELTVEFDRLYHPAGKLSGVYNMAAVAAYTSAGGEETLVGSTSDQYKFSSTAASQTVTGPLEKSVDSTYARYTPSGALTVPADYQEDTYVLSGGSLIVLGYGDAYGEHRGIKLDVGREQNFNATVKEAYLGRLPDIEIPIVASDSELTGITLDTTNVKTAYYAGDSFDAANLVVTAKYADGKTQKVKNYTVAPQVLTADTTAVVVTYRGATAEIPVQVTPKTVTAVEITTPPSKTAYVAGEAFSTAGMVVTATYNDGTREATGDYTYSPAGALSTGVSAITVTCGGLTATTPITVTAAASSGGEAGDNVTVYFTLYGDEAHGAPTSDKDTHTLKKGNLTTWIARTSVRVPKDSTVADVIAKALASAGIPYENPSGNYVTSIRGLAEFTNGNLSGWMYTLNGVHPNLGVEEQTVQNGDVIVFHYTDDYTVERGAEALGGSGGGAGGKGSGGGDSNLLQPGTFLNGAGQNEAGVTANEINKAIEGAKEDNLTNIVIEPNIKGGGSSIMVKVALDGAKAIADAKMGLTVNTAKGSVVIGEAALQSIASQAGGIDIRFIVEAKDTKAEAVKNDATKALQQAAASLRGTVESLFNNASVTEVTITSNNKAITSFGGHELTINLPVARDKFTEGRSYKVVVMSADGKVETIIGKCVKYDGQIVVQVQIDHLSTFIVTNETEKEVAAQTKMNFADVNKGQWFYEAVKFVYEAGLMNGTDGNKFEPNGNLNRAMLVTILYRLENQPEITANNKFTDVKSGQWYTEAVVWASANGIVNGYEDNTFKPMNNVSREETAAMLMRYAEYKDVDVSAAKDLSGYGDAAKVAAWAKQNMAWANSAGLIQGDENNNLNPQGKATRAEAATILMRLVKNVIG